MVGRILGRGELRDLFAQCTTAFRLEVHTFYEDADNVPFQQWLGGAAPDDSWLQSWVDTVRTAVSNGRCIRRVRVLTDPPSSYQRFARDLALRCNIPAGEDIRVLDEKQRGRLDLPAHDFWLFDDEHPVVLDFGTDGSFAQARTLTDGVERDQHRGWAQRAWDHAVPYEQHGSALE